MSTTAPKPATTPIPVQLSETEFTAFTNYLNQNSRSDDNSPVLDTQGGLSWTQPLNQPSGKFLMTSGH
jgi:hypothetical protein